jgi:hypothetical protein
MVEEIETDTPHVTAALYKWRLSRDLTYIHMDSVEITWRYTAQSFPELPDDIKCCTTCIRKPDYRTSVCKECSPNYKNHKSFKEAMSV